MVNKKCKLPIFKESAKNAFKSKVLRCKSLVTIEKSVILQPKASF